VAGLIPLSQATLCRLTHQAGSSIRTLDYRAINPSIIAA
jgi:hypothetical protein